MFHLNPLLEVQFQFWISIVPIDQKQTSRNVSSLFTSHIPDVANEIQIMLETDWKSQL